MFNRICIFVFYLTTMKYLILSDIHGSEKAVQKALSYFKSLKADRILILGDILYHGPRNPIPSGYNPQGVVALLNLLKDSILAVRGNCEAEVDQMLLDFPCMGDFLIVQDGDNQLFVTHGHLYSPASLPSLPKGAAFLYGHTHLWQATIQDGIILFNPGSITLPKENRPATFGIYEDGCLSVCRLDDGQVLSSVDMSELK